MIRVTASRLALLKQCRYSAKDGVPWSDQSGAAAGFGTLLHAALADYLTTEKLPNFGDADDYERLSKSFAQGKAWLDANRRVGMRAEVAFALDPATGRAREIGQDIGRDYEAHGAKPGEVCGSADVVSMDGDCVVVYDWKSANVWIDTQDATEQLNGLAVMAADAYGAKRARIVTLKVTDEGVYETPAELDVFTLASAAEDIRALVSSIPAAEPVPGDWCSERWCPARLSCPATTKTVEQVLPVDALTKRFAMGTDIQGPEHASWMLHRVELLLDMGEQIRGALKGYARANGGIPVEGGKVWAEVPSVRQSVDGKAALALAEKAGADPLDLANCMRSATVNSFRKVKAKGRAA